MNLSNNHVQIIGWQKIVRNNARTARDVAKGRATGAMAPPWAIRFALDKCDSTEL